MHKRTDWGLVVVLGAVCVPVALMQACTEDDRPGQPSTLTTSTGTGGTTSSGGGGTGGTAGQTNTGGTTNSGGGGTGGGGGAGGGPPPEHCTNNQHDDADGETDVDCGGPCPGCAAGLNCNIPPDCESLSCVGNVCQIPTCVDGIHNGDETDEDCGGPNCGPCEDGSGCTEPEHCQSGVCSNDVCQVPTCGDNVQNGDETDTDCGGSCPGLCLIGKGCDGNDDCVGANCQSNICDCLPGMEIVPTLGGGAYCIDEHEVTYAEYEVFWVGNPDPASQIPECLWNLNFTPQVGWPSGNDALPVVGVNWCEAYAYCTSQGRHLCGQVGGGSSAYGDYANANTNQWYNACSAQNQNLFPYSGTYQADACNGLDNGLGTTMAPACSGSPPVCVACVGGAPDLRHMSGNVKEWEDSCNGSAGATDSCRLRGGSYQSGQSALRCDANDALTRNSAAVDIGFRCCLY